MENKGIASGGIEVDLLGGLRIRTATACFAVSSARLQGIFSMLAISVPCPVTVDVLIDELWSENPPRNARNAVQAGVARLRRITEAARPLPLAGELIRTVPHGYQLAVPHAAIDANRFVEQIRRGAQLVWHSPAEAVERLRSALLLWRGPAVFKANSGVRRQAAAAVLDECHVMAQEDLIVAQLLLGRHREVLSELRGLTAQHPERERLAELLMIALYQSGRQTESLNEFHRARRLLRERFGVEPGPGLHRLQRVILQRQTGIGTLLGQPLDRAPVPAGLQ